jgi:hypothetical protein
VEYRFLDGLRKQIGREMQTNVLIADDGLEAGRKALYKALAADLERGAFASGGQKAVNAVKKANLNKVFDEVVSGSLDNTNIIRQTMKGMTAAQRNVVAKSYIQRMGKLKTDGTISQDWNIESFLTSYNSANPIGRQLLLKGTPEIRRDLTAFVKNINKSVASARNPTATKGQGLAAARMSLALGSMGGVLGGAVTGAAVGTIGAAAGGIIPGVIFPFVAANGAARLMSSPVFLKWAARASRAPEITAKHFIQLQNIVRENSDASLINDIDSFVHMLILQDEEMQDNIETRAVPQEQR